MGAAGLGAGVVDGTGAGVGVVVSASLGFGVTLGVSCLGGGVDEELLLLPQPTDMIIAPVSSNAKSLVTGDPFC